MDGHTVFELCDRCGSPSIDVVDDVCHSCGHQNRLLTVGELVTLCSAAAVVGGAVAMALGWWS
jgi:hypothetical protein